MSSVFSISGRRRYGLARVCRVWDVPRAGIYRRRRAANLPEPPRRRPGPQGAMPDAALVEEIRVVLTGQPFSRRGVSQGMGAPAAQGPADLEAARAPPDAGERPFGGYGPGDAAGSAGPRWNDHPGHGRYDVGYRHDGRGDERVRPRWRSSSPSITARPNASASMPRCAARATRRWSRCARA